MGIQNELMQRLGVRHPIIQAPMAGGGDTPDLVAAVCEAGGLGSVGAAYLTPEQIERTGAAVRERTSRAWGINLFAPASRADAERTPAGADVRAAAMRVAPYYAELGLGAPAIPELAPDFFEAQVEACASSGAAVFSFTFGVAPSRAIETAKAAGMLVMGTATTVEEAVMLERAGVDAVVAQGSEAGGHRGTFAGPFESAMVGTMALVPQVVDAVRVPVVASGGIMDGRGIAAALALGADAVQIGTAFLVTPEAGVPEAYKRAVLGAREDWTRITRAFSGRPARGIANRFMEEVERGGEILPFPLQNALTRPMRTAAAKAGRAEFLSLWAGQGVRMARREGAAAMVERLARELQEALAQLGPA